MNKNKTYSNLTQEEKEAIRELANNDRITIKPADKGGAIVIQDTDKYISEAVRQLDNRNHYRRTGQNTTSKVNETINAYIRECKKAKTIPSSTADYLMTKNSKILHITKNSQRGCPRTTHH